MPRTNHKPNPEDNLGSTGLAPAKSRVETSPCGKFEFVYPDDLPRNKVKSVPDKGADPIRAAEHHLMVMSCEYADWATDLRTRLRRAAHAYSEKPKDGRAQADLKKLVHEIKGDAPAFGYVLAGNFAASLAALMERDCKWWLRCETIRMAITATIATLSEDCKKNLPIHLEVHNALAELIGRHLEECSRKLTA